MTPDEIRALQAEAESKQAEATALFRKLDDERAQRESFTRTVDNVMQTRGGTLAWTLLSPIASGVVDARQGRTSYGYCDAAEGKGFHWRGGLYFHRDRDGSVILSDWRPFLTDSGERKWTGKDIAVIDADSWASIVASVSRSGEQDGRYDRARSFHND